MGLINIFKPLPTFLQPGLLIKLSNIDNFFYRNFLGMQGIKPGAAGGKASMVTPWWAAPLTSKHCFGYVANRKEEVKAKNSPAISRSQTLDPLPALSSTSIFYLLFLVEAKKWIGPESYIVFQESYTEVAFTLLAQPTQVRMSARKKFCLMRLSPSRTLL